MISEALGNRCSEPNPENVMDLELSEERRELKPTTLLALRLLQAALKFPIKRAERAALEHIADLRKLLEVKLLAHSAASSLRSQAEADVRTAASEVLGLEPQEFTLRTRLVDVLPSASQRQLWRAALSSPALKQHFLATRLRKNSRFGQILLNSVLIAIVWRVLDSVAERFAWSHWLSYVLIPMVLTVSWVSWRLRSAPRPNSRAWTWLGCFDNVIQRWTLELAAQLREERGMGLTWTTEEARELTQAAFALAASTLDPQNNILASEVLDETPLLRAIRPLTKPYVE